MSEPKDKDKDDAMTGEVVDGSDDLLAFDYEKAVKNPVYRNLVEFAYGVSWIQSSRPNAFMVQTLIDPDAGEEFHLSVDAEKAKRLDAYYEAEQRRGTGSVRRRVDVQMPDAATFRERVVPTLREGRVARLPAQAKRRTSRPAR